MIRNPAYKETIIERLKGQHFMHHNEMKITSIEWGKIVLEMPIKQIHKQQHGFVHGGAISTAVDIVMGFAAYSVMDKDAGVVTANLSVDYHFPGIGDKLIAIGKVDKSGSKMVFCSADFFVENAGERKRIGSAKSIMAVINKS